MRIGLLGLGTVGAGTLALWQNNRMEIVRKLGTELTFSKALVRDVNRERDCDLTGLELTTNPEDIINSPEIDVVVEMLGGVETPYDYVARSLKNGKHVVTANKALLATHGDVLFQLAKEQGVQLAFEAAVAGGIPIIKALREGLAANNIDSIFGIINGTSNFIVSHMHEGGADFSESLKLAQENGYAEADPTLDINGEDVAHKITLLAATAFGVPVQSIQDIYVEGITKLTQQDVQYAEELGYTIKQLGFAKRSQEGIQVRVHPAMIPDTHPLAHIGGVMNAITVHAQPIGETLYYGPGAGAGPTASAVMADIMDVVRECAAPATGFQAGSIQALPQVAMSALRGEYYLRLDVIDEAGVLADVTRILGDMGISIEAMLQKERAPSSAVPVVILTHETKESDVSAAVAQMQQLSKVTTVQVIRIAKL